MDKTVHHSEVWTGQWFYSPSEPPPHLFLSSSNNLLRVGMWPFFHGVKSLGIFWHYGRSWGTLKPCPDFLPLLQGTQGSRINMSHSTFNKTSSLRYTRCIGKASVVYDLMRGKSLCVNGYPSTSSAHYHALLWSLMGESRGWARKMEREGSTKPLLHLPRLLVGTDRMDTREWLALPSLELM